MIAESSNTPPSLSHGGERIELLLPAQRMLLDQVQKGLSEIAAGGNSRAILFSGPSGTGKTTALDRIADPYPPYLDGVQRCVPCCRVAAFSKGDTGSVAQSILRQLGKPLAATRKLKARELEEQVYAAIPACRVLILILEEFHNALVESTKQLRGQLAEFLKNLWNLHPGGDSRSWALPQAGRGDWRILMIVSGTEKIRQAFDTDDEISSRFSRINVSVC